MLGVLLAAAVGLQQPWLYASVSSRGPAQWPTLTDGTNTLYPTCGGSQQSPVDIQEAVIDDALLPLLYSYVATGDYVVTHNRAFVRVEFTRSAGTLSDPNMGGKLFELKYFDIHTPAEHTIEGGLTDMELQLVHEAAATGQPATAAAFTRHSTLVTAILVKGESSVANPLLEAFINRIPVPPIAASTLYQTAFAAFTPTQMVGVGAIDMTSVLPLPWTSIRHSSKEREYFTYEGSLTSPFDGCREGVMWYVYAHAIPTSAAQVAAMRDRLGVVEEEAVARQYGFPLQNCEVFGNNRPPQSLNGRVVRMYSVSGIAEVGSVISGTDTSITTTQATCDSNLQQPWLYAEVGARGPSSWPTIPAFGTNTPLYPTCGAGVQAPINLATQGSVITPELKALNFQYGTVTGYTIANDGAAVQIRFQTPPGYVVDTNINKRFELTHVVFRTPSEHSVEGGHFAMEMQLMHKESTGQASGAPGEPSYLGAAVLFQMGGPDNTFLDKVWAQLQRRPRTPAEHYDAPYASFKSVERSGLSVPLDFLAGLPAAKGYYTYDGSLTQPPCTQGVKWYVYTTPNSMSQAQVQTIAAVMNFSGEVQVAQSKGFVPERCTTFGNNRPVQPQGTRVVRRTQDAPSTRGTVYSAQDRDVVCRDQAWLYADVLNRGPQSWGALKSPTTQSLLFPTCSSGAVQSPVRIDEARIDTTLVPLTYSFVRGRQFTVQNWQNMMKVVFVSSPGFVTDSNMGGKRFNLVEFQLHSPSEHAVGTGLRQMELIMVHEADAAQPPGAQSFSSTKWLHVSVLFELESTDNQFLASFWGALQSVPKTATALFASPTDPIEPRVSAPLSPNVDLTGALPKLQDFFTYDGSKTAPPCTEGVRWYVYSTPSGISASQLSVFRTKMGFQDELLEAQKNTFTKADCETYGNNRPLQALNGRAVQMFTQSGVAQEGAVQGATEPPPTSIPPGTTITTSTSDVVQIVDPSSGGGQGACGAGGTGFQPWGYAEAAGRGPSSWGGITSQGGGAALFPTCGAGATQSPVNVNQTNTATDLNLQPLQFSYNTVCQLNVENNQRAQVLTVRASPWHTGGTPTPGTSSRSGETAADPPDRTPAPLTCTDARSLGYVQDPNLGSKRFELSHVEFHSPSEHSIEGGLYDMEVQFHHREAIGQPANANVHDKIQRVSVAVLMKVREADNPVLEKFWPNLRATPLDPSTLYTSAWQSFTPSVAAVEATFSPQELLPISSDFVTYEGSITVPPCTEGVQWYVYTTPLEVGRKQLDLFRERMGFTQELETAKTMGFSPSKCATFGNNRPVQELKGRVLKRSSVQQTTREEQGTVTSAHGEDLRCTVQPWVYTEGTDRGPSSWGTMRQTPTAAPLYPTCSSGNSVEQSPVDISEALLDPALLPLDFRYPQQVGYVVENNQKNGRVSFDNEDGSRGHVVDANLGQKRYDLHNLHFHSPSEHSVNGGLYDMEMHIVHRESGSSLQPQGSSGFGKYRDLVVTLLFEVTAADNPWLEAIWPYLQNTPLTPQAAYADPFAGFHRRSSQVIDVPFNVEAALPVNREYFTYDGSFTEPPCTEGVKWYVYTTPVGVSQAQLTRYRTSMNLTGELTEAAKRGFYPKPCTTFGNNRPTQPLNQRAVKMSSDAGVVTPGMVDGATKQGGFTTTPTSASCEAPQLQQPWLYTEARDRGPSKWGTVTAPAGGTPYATCSTGTQQSPANMEDAVVDNALQELVYKYSQAGTYSVVNDQASVHLQFKAGTMGAMQDPNAGGTRYEVTGVTFKAPSEHTVGGKHFDMEMQIWHKRATGQPDTATGPPTAAVSLLYQAGGEAKNAWLDAFWGQLPTDPVSQETLYASPYQLFAANVQTVDRMLNIQAALPQQKEYFTYEGSETAPPCTEGKRWYVYSTPQAVSTAQLGELRNALGLGQEAAEAQKAGFNIKPCTQVGNIRPPQPLGARQVRMRSATGTSPTGTVTSATDPAVATAAATCAVGAVRPWHYAELNGRGPNLWPTLGDQNGVGPLYPTCGGAQQSPVALDAPFIDGTLQDLKYTYAATGPANAFTLENDGAVIRMTFTSSPGFVEDPNQSNRRYALTHVEFHTPGEHTIDGGRYSMEVMLHHQATAGQAAASLSGSKYVVVSVFFDARSSDSPWLAAFWGSLPNPPVGADAHYANPFIAITRRASAASTNSLDVAAALPRVRDMFAYDGSMTAPPCEESARRYIYSTPQLMSTAQHTQLRTALGLDDAITAYEARASTTVLDRHLFGNARPVQPAGTRVIRYTAGSTAVRPPLTQSPPGTTAVPSGPTPVPVAQEVAYVVIPNMSLLGVSEPSRSAISSAAVQDLSAAFGITSDRISLQLMEHAGTNGSLFVYSLDTTGLANPELVLQNVQKAYTDRSLQMPRTEAAYLAATGRQVPGTVDFVRSGVVRDTSGFTTSARVAIPNIDWALVPATQQQALVDAARADLAAQYGVYPSRVVSRITPGQPGILVPHTVNTLGLSNATAVHQLISNAFNQKSHTFPRLAEAYRVATGTTVVPQVEYGAGKSELLSNVKTLPPGRDNLVGKTFRMLVNNPFGTFNVQQFLDAVRVVVQDAAVAPVLQWVCPGTACPNFVCVRTRQIFLSNGCRTTLSALRAATPLQDSGQQTYLEFDMVPIDASTAAVDNDKRNYARDLVDADLNKQSAGTLPAWGAAQFGTADVITEVVPTLAPNTTAGVPGPKDDVTDEWWFWLLIALAAILFLLMVLLLLCCCGKKKDGEGKGRSASEQSRDHDRDMRPKQISEDSFDTYGTREVSPHVGWEHQERDVFVYSRDGSDEPHDMQEIPDAGFPSGCPVDVNYNGVWTAARVLSRDTDGTYTVDWGEEGMVTRGVHPADVRERSEGLFCVGDNVMAWHNGEFYPAVITDHNPNGTYDVRWEDGSLSKGLSSPELRLDHERHGVIPLVDDDVASPNQHLVGQTVDVFWDGEWGMGTVRSANTDGSVVIQWVDGTYTDGVDPTLIRPVVNPIEHLGFASARPSGSRVSN